MNNGLLRTGAIALALALIAGFCATPRARAQETEAITTVAFAAGDQVEVFDGRLNLREAVGLDAEILEVLEDGALLTIVSGPDAADDIDWYEVTTEGSTTGWVTSEFIRAVGTAEPFVAGDEVVVASGPLNLREAAGTDAEIVETLPEDTAAKVLSGPAAADDFDWYEIEIDDDSAGWVAGQFLALAEAVEPFVDGDAIVVTEGPLNLRGGASLSATVLAQLQEGDTGTVTGGPSEAGDITWYQIDVADGETGWVAGQFLALAAEETPAAGDFPVDSFVFVNAPVINLRADASIDADILDTINDGNIMTVLDGPVVAGDYDWYQVAVGEGQNTQQGWVSGALISGGFALNADALVADGPLNLREEASTDADSVAVLETGATVTVVAGPIVGGGFLWFEVTSGDETGFVAGRYLGAAEPQ